MSFAVWWAAAGTLYQVEEVINHMNWAAISAIGACLAALFSLIVTLSERSKDRQRRRPRLYITKIDPTWVSGEEIDPANIDPICLGITNSGAETLYDVELTFHNDRFFSAFRKFVKGGALADIGADDNITLADSKDSFMISTNTGRYQASRRTLPLRHALYPTDAAEFQVEKPYTELFVKYLHLMGHHLASRLSPDQYLDALDEAPAMRISVRYKDMYDKVYEDVFNLKSQLYLRSPDDKNKRVDPADGPVKTEDLMIRLSVEKET